MNKGGSNEEIKDNQLATNTPAPVGENNVDGSDTDVQAPAGSKDSVSAQEPQRIQWFYLWIGAAGSLILLVLASIFIAKSYYK